MNTLIRACALLATVAAAALPATASAQRSSSNVVRVVVPFAAGGSADMVARLIGTKLAEGLGRSVIVDNKSGAGGQIGLQDLILSAPDGNTLLVTPSGPISISPLLQQLPYDPPKDLVPIAMLAIVPTGVAVNAQSPIQNLQELISTAKSSKTGVLYSVPAIGTHMHLAGALLESMTGAKLQAVPYRGTSPAVAAVASGEVTAGVSDLVTLLPMAAAGRLRILAMTGVQRTSSAPTIATVAELGVAGYSADAWIGMFAPAGTPQAVVDQLNAEIGKILQQPDVRKTLTSSGLEPAPLTSAAGYAKSLADDRIKWAGVIQKAKIKLESN